MKRSRHSQRTQASRFAFSLPEVTLSLAILGAGLTSTMRLITTSLTTRRNSLGETYAADSAERMLNLFAWQLRNPQNNYEKWDSLGLSLPSSKPGVLEPRTWHEWTSEENMTLWRGTGYDFMKVEQKATGASSPDFSAVYRLWRGAVSTWQYVDGDWTEVGVSPNRAMTVKLEISWPVEAPYAQRRKVLYTLNVFKPE